MPIEVKCDQCGKGLKAPDTMAGKKAKCPGCGAILVVPLVEEILDAEVIEPESSSLDSLLDDELAYRVAEPDPVSQPAAESRRQCPACGEMIVSTAAKCRFCGEVFDATLRKMNRNLSSEEIKKFRREMHGLGGFWIVIGAFAAVLGVVMASVDMPRTADMDVDARTVGAAFVVILGAAWITLGIFTCLKHIWAVYVGLVISYISLLGNLVNLNVCGLIIIIAVIVQAHRCISAAKKFRAAGVELTALPGR